MKTKIILISTVVVAALGFFSFKSVSQQADPKVVIVSVANGKGDNEGFIITWGDGRVEKRAFEISVMPNVDNWIKVQSKMATIANELEEKGYHYAGSHAVMLNGMVFEKK